MKHLICSALVLLLIGATGTQAQDSLNMRRTGGIPVWDGSFSIAISGDYAYIATASSGLRIMNIANQASPREVAIYNSGASAYSVAVQGNLAFVTTGTALEILDISTPTAPVRLSSMAGTVYKVAVQGNYAYVLKYEEPFEMLTAVDISDPASPQFLGNYFVDGTDVVLRGTLAYVTAADNMGPFDGLHIVDIYDPQSLTRVSYLHLDYAYGLALAGNTVCIADEHTGFRTVDVSDPANPVEAGFCSLGNWAHAVKTQGNYAYVADMGGVISAVDISDPAQPAVVHTFETPVGSSLRDLSIIGSRAFVVGGSNGLRILDITDPLAMREIGYFSTPIGLGGVAISGSIVCAADLYNLLRCIDISNPSLPVEVGYLRLSSLFCVAVEGHLAYCGDGNGLRVADFANPAAPVYLGGIDCNGVENLAVANGFVYTANWDATLKVIDATTPTFPHIVAQIGEEGSGGIAVAGDYAYLIAYNAGVTRNWLRIYDITSPASPVELGSVELPELCGSVAVTPNYAYVAGQQSLFIVNVWQPSQPQVMGSIPQMDHAKLTLAGSMLYVAAAGGIRVYNVSTPTAPELVGYYYNQSSANYNGAAVSGNHIYAAGENLFDVLQLGESGLTSQAAVPPTKFALHPAYPNPFNPSTMLTFSLPANASVTLQVYDVLGRLVSTVYHGYATAGNHSVSFDGTELSGGIYFARLQTPTLTMTQKLVLLK